MAGFERTLDELFARAAPDSVLDVGCGEGVLTQHWAERARRAARSSASTSRTPSSRAEWAARGSGPTSSSARCAAGELPFADGEFDLVAAIEVLEHVPDPERTVAEMARVARRHLLVSVPHEPLWRVLNVARGAYVRELGNTPGHVNHWSKRAFVRLLGRYGEVVEARSPFPWTMLLVRVRLMSEGPAGAPERRLRLPSGARRTARPGQRRWRRRRQQPDGSYASGARILTIGIASTGIFTFAYLATASHVLSQQAYGRVSLCWAIMFVILSVIYRPIEQLLSRTIADRRARGLHGHPLRVPALIQVGFALLFLVVALALRPQIEHDLFDGSSALYWILVIGVLAYAASYFARGWLAGHQRFALYGGLVFLESTSRFLFALGRGVGIASGQSVVALGMAVAPFVSLAVIPFAFSRVRAAPVGRAAPPRPRTIELGLSGGRRGRRGPRARRLEEASADLSLVTAPASPSRWSGSCSPSRR